MVENKTKWYTIAVVPGRELKVLERIEKEHERRPISGLVQLYCPVENITTETDTKIKQSKRALCGGYIFVEVTTTGGIISACRTISGAIGVLMDRSGKPSVVSNKEIQRFMDKKPTNKVEYKYKSMRPGDLIIVKDGPFEGQRGRFISYTTDSENEANIEMTFFGKPVEMSFWVSNLDKSNI